MFPCDFEFDEETVRARALEVFQDDLFADGCLESYHSGALSLNELADKILSALEKAGVTCTS